MQAQFFADYLQELEILQHRLHTDVRDLPPDAMDWSPGPQMNSVAVLLAHIAGVLSADMLRRLDAVVDYVRDTLPRLSLTDLDNVRQDEDGTVTCGWVLLHALDHAYLHLGHVQITCQLWRQREKERALTPDHPHTWQGYSRLS